MAKSEQDTSYYVYLTKRMDRGESKNIVLPTAVEQIMQHLTSIPEISVLDVGCFNGAMLNQIRNMTPERFRNRVKYVGAELNEELITDGRKKYPKIQFVQADLKKSISHLGTYDIVVVSNVLHEMIPFQEEDGNTIEEIIKDALLKISLLVKERGSLIVLDGLKPDNDDKQITINHKSTDSFLLYKLFAERYSAIQVNAKEVGENQTETRLKDLVAFLTKARYLNEDYWPIESSQLYQYFTREQFYKFMVLSGFQVEKFEPQEFSPEQMDNIFNSVTPQIDYPAKNVLIVARKL